MILRCVPIEIFAGTVGLLQFECACMDNKGTDAQKIRAQKMSCAKNFCAVNAC